MQQLSFFPVEEVEWEWERERERERSGIVERGETYFRASPVVVLLQGSLIQGILPTYIGIFWNYSERNKFHF